MKNLSNTLIPEQRVDKNGRINTKHVRASKPQTASSKVPPPTLPAAKASKTKLTPGQTTPKNRNIQFAARGDYDLSKSLGYSSQNEDVDVHASDEEFYSVLSVTSTGNALMLLRAGHRSAAQASEYLTEEGFEGLLADNSALCEEALARRIPPHKFIQASIHMRSPENSEHYMDALEVYSSSHTQHNRPLVQKVYDGEVKLSDIKEVGFKRLGGFKGNNAVTLALMKISSGTASYTTDDISTLMDRHPNIFKDALTFTERYGMEFTLSVSDPDISYSDYLEERGTDKERAMALLHYGDEVEQYQAVNSIYREPVSYATLERCHDAGLTPAQVANDDYTEQQLDALIQGATPGVSSGWL